MNKITIIGHFGENGVCQGGQSVKTVTITNELKKLFGDENISCCKTKGRKIDIVSAPSYIRKALLHSENTIIFPAKNSLRVFVPLLVIGNMFFHRKLHYCVIGGWLPEFIKSHRYLIKPLMTFDGIYVETTAMKNALEAMGFCNIFIMPNCKDLKILREDELVYYDAEPLKLCTFSRVMKEKGIEDAVNAVKAINAKYGKTVYTLDIYGQIDANQNDWFEKLKRDFSDYIKYKGVVPFNESVDILKEYYALLFPTRFYTEGIPGTIIDAYAAGVPVIGSRWQNYSDIITENKTGIGFEFCCFNELVSVLVNVSRHPNILNDMKKYCIERAKDYTPEVALLPLIREIEK